MNKRTASVCMLLAVTLTGCANMNETQRGTATGTGLGAAAGRLLSVLLVIAAAALSGADVVMLDLMPLITRC